MIEAAVENSLNRLVSLEGPLLVAVSGGLDSSVLLQVLSTLAQKRGFACVAGHVNHGLRGDESEADEVSVRTLAQQLGVGVRVAHIDPASQREGHVSRTRPTLQEAARRLRYEALRKLAGEAGARHIATAHHQDDQAETLLMRLFRGSGPDGLGGIPETSPDGMVLRPLLDVTREQIRLHAEAHGLCWREDSSNNDLRYTRNRVRAEWIPRLSEAFNPQLVRKLAEQAESQRRDAEWIEGLVAEVAQGLLIVRPEQDAVELGKAGWDAFPEALARRLVQRAVREAGAGRDLTRVHLTRVLAFLRSAPDARNGAFIELPGSLRLVRERERYLLTRMIPAG